MVSNFPARPLTLNPRRVVFDVQEILVGRVELSLDSRGGKVGLGSAILNSGVNRSEHGLDRIDGRFGVEVPVLIDVVAQAKGVFGLSQRCVDRAQAVARGLALRLNRRFGRGERCLFGDA